MTMEHMLMLMKLCTQGLHSLGALGPENAAILERIGAELQRRGLPVVLGGDFQMAPEALADTPAMPAASNPANPSNS